MIQAEDLLECLVRYGRSMVQDFVTRSRHIEDTIHYLQAERCLEMARLFVAKDLGSFEGRKESL